VVLTNTVTLAGGVNSATLTGSAYPASTNLVGLGMNWAANAGNGSAQTSDTIYRWSPTGGYSSYVYSPSTGWGGTPGGAGPVLNVAEGFWYINQNTQSDTWTQSFTVN
jgi:hypothetical protein